MALKARERVARSLEGADVDRPPLCLWHHFQPAGSAAALASATIQFFGDLDLDIFKIMPDLPYPAPPGGQITTPEAWATLPSLGAGPGEALDGMASAVAAVRRSHPEAVILATVFSPLATALHLAGGALAGVRVLQRDMASAQRGLEVLAANLAGSCAACLASGADGIYFATAGLGDGLLTEAEYRTLGRPYDLEALAASAPGWCNVLHMHAATALHWRWVADYAPPVFSWSDRQTGVPLATVAGALPGKTVMGGIDETGAIVRGDRAGLEAEVRDAIAQTGGRRLILAGGCSLPDAVPVAHLRMARALVDDLRRK